MTSSTRKHPLDFRQEEVGRIMHCWRATDSCSLVGVGSVGKTNLLQHLADKDVQASYMERTRSVHFKSIIIDPNMLGPLPTAGDDLEQIKCWAGYELMMHRLFTAFYPLEELGDDDSRAFFEMYRSLQDGTNPLYAYMGLRYFELGLEFFMRRGIQIAFMFDEFEELLEQMPIKFFQTLRGLRDANKKQLSYVTFTRAPLPDLIERYELDPLRIEPFVELFTDKLIYIGPYNATDSRRFVDDLMRRNNMDISSDVTAFLIWATGGFAGLLRASFHQLTWLLNNHRMTDIEDQQLANQLVKREPVEIECRTIWQSLSPIERHTLRAAVRLEEFMPGPETDHATSLLAKKRLLKLDQIQQRTLRIEPPIFKQFVLTTGNE